MTKTLNLIVLAMLLGTAACGRQGGSGQSQNNAAANPSAGSQPAVTLTDKQLKMLKVAAIGSYVFHPERDVIGTVSFYEDPTILQAEATVITNAATDRQMSAELARASQLRETNGVSERELEQAKTDAATAKANYLSARSAALALGKTDSELNRMVSAASLPVSPSQRQKWVSLNPTEQESQFFRAGQTLRITTADFPGQQFRGTLWKVYATVDPNSHRVTMRARVEDEQNQLKPGMLVTATVQTGAPFNALAVPDAAIVREGDGSLTAWVYQGDHRFVQRTVTTGYRQDGQVQIVRGLSPGERVVTSGGIYLDNMLQAPSGD
jgi:membrane fusion protein, heavy metal efflux system